MLETYVHDSNAILFVYDITNIQSFNDVEAWIREVSIIQTSKANQPDGTHKIDEEKDQAIKILLGNK